MDGNYLCDPTSSVGKSLVNFVSTLPPFYIPVTENNVTRVDGILGYLVHFICRAMRRPYVLLDSGEPEIGHQVGPGNWTSVIGMMHREEADLFGGLYAGQPEIFPIVGFSTAFDAATFTVLSGPPNKISERPATFLSAVGIDFWACLCTTWVLLSTGYVFVSRAEHKFIDGTFYRESIVESLLTFYGLLFQRGFDNLPETPVRRVWVSGWLFLVIILMTELAGTLSSKLAVSNVPERIDKIDDVLKFPTLKPYVVKGIVADTHLEQSETAVKSAVWRQIQKFNGVREYEEFIQPGIMAEVSRGEAVVISNTEGILANIVGHACIKERRPFYLAKEPFFQTPVVLLYSKSLDPDLAEEFHRVAVLFGSVGLHSLFWKNSAKDAHACYQSKDSLISYKPMTVRDTLAVMQLLGTGLAASLSLCILEIFLGAGVSCTEKGKRRLKKLKVNGIE